MRSLSELKKLSFTYICTLEKNEQATIEQALKTAGMEGQDLQDAMDSRIVDVEDVL